MTLYGCDVSQYQAGLDLGPLVKQGYSFCWIRASIGAQEDPEFLRFLWQAQSAGMIAAGYHFLVPSRSVALENQAHLFATVLAGTPGVLDIEPNGPGAQVPAYQEVTDFLGWARAYGADIRALYWPRWVWDLQGRPELPGGYALISSNYTTAYDGETLAAQYPGKSWPGWAGYGGLVPQLGQVTDAAGVGQNAGPIDGDIFEGTTEQLMAIFGLEDSDMAKLRMVKTAEDPAVWATDGNGRWHIPAGTMGDFVFNQHTRFGNPGMPATPEIVEDLASCGPVRADMPVGA